MPLPQSEGVVVEVVCFQAGPYLLEGELAYGEDVARPRGAVVVASSHPLLGGNLHNNVVRGLGDGLAEQGWLTLRFNYRGVGRSQGPPRDVARQMAEFWQTSHVADELELGDDLQAAVSFLRGIGGPALPLTLIGYSFGSVLLPCVSPAHPSVAHVLIAPPLARHDYRALAEVAGPLLVIAAEDDFATDPARLRQWFAQLPSLKRLVLVPNGNHFFRGQEPWLVETVSAFLQDHHGPGGGHAPCGRGGEFLQLDSAGGRR